VNFLGPSSHRPDMGTRCVRILIRGCLCLCLYLIFVHLDQFRYLRRAWSGLGFLQRRSRILTFAQHMKLQVQVQGQAPPVLLISSLLLAESPQPCATVGTELASGFATATRTVWQVRWQHRRSRPHALNSGCTSLDAQVDLNQAGGPLPRRWILNLYQNISRGTNR